MPLLISIDDNKTISTILRSDRSIIDAKNKNGETALIDAIKREKYVKADTLLNYNAKVNIKDQNGINAIKMLQSKNDYPNSLLRRLEAIDLMQNTEFIAFANGSLRIPRMSYKIKEDIVIPANAYKIIITYSGSRGPSNEIIELIKMVKNSTVDRVFDIVEQNIGNKQDGKGAGEEKDALSMYLSPVHIATLWYETPRYDIVGLVKGLFDEKIGFSFKDSVIVESSCRTYESGKKVDIDKKFPDKVSICLERCGDRAILGDLDVMLGVIIYVDMRNALTKSQSNKHLQDCSTTIPNVEKYGIQVGAFNNFDLACAGYKKYNNFFPELAKIIKSNDNKYRVTLGEYSTSKEAETEKRKLGKFEYKIVKYSDILK